MAKILVIDDEAGIASAFERFLRQLGHQPLIASSAEQGLAMFQKESPELVFMDVKLPGMNGLDAFRQLQKLSPRAKVVVMTAHGTLDTALEAVKLGALEYLNKPFDLEEVRQVLAHALDKISPSAEIAQAKAEIKQFAMQRIVGRTPAMQQVFKTIAAVAQSDAPVLIVGESGTGKELVARAIHYNSRRASAPFEPINCACIPENLLESELFGHEKGAFTGAVSQKIGKCELANGGTLFLDEISEMSLTAQAKLLRFVEEKEFTRVGGTDNIKVNLRILAATNQNLQEWIEAKRFREDLYFRLNVVSIELPPLRERREDIPLLVAYFLQEAGAAHGVSEKALEALKQAPWHGNVRELRNVLERAVVLARDKVIEVEHLPDTLTSPSASAADSLERKIEQVVEAFLQSPQSRDGALYKWLEAHWEKILLKKTLERAGGNQVKASALLGISRMTLSKKLEEYGLK